MTAQLGRGSCGNTLAWGILLPTAAIIVASACSDEGGGGNGEGGNAGSGAASGESRSGVATAVAGGLLEMREPRPILAAWPEMRAAVVWVPAGSGAGGVSGCGDGGGAAVATVATWESCSTRLWASQIAPLTLSV